MSYKSRAQKTDQSKLLHHCQKCKESLKAEQDRKDAINAEHRRRQAVIQREADESRLAQLQQMSWDELIQAHEWKYERYEILGEQAESQCEICKKGRCTLNIFAMEDSRPDMNGNHITLGQFLVLCNDCISTTGKIDRNRREIISPDFLEFLFEQRYREQGY